MALLIIGMYSNQITAIDEGKGGWKGTAQNIGSMVFVGFCVAVTTGVFQRLVIDRLFPAAHTREQLEIQQRTMLAYEQHVANTKQRYLVPDLEDTLKMAEFWDKQLNRCLESQHAEECDKLTKYREQNLELMGKTQYVQIRRMENQKY